MSAHVPKHGRKRATWELEEKPPSRHAGCDSRNWTRARPLAHLPSKPTELGSVLQFAPLVQTPNCNCTPTHHFKNSSGLIITNSNVTEKSHARTKLIFQQGMYLQFTTTNPITACDCWARYFSFCNYSTSAKLSLLDFLLLRNQPIRIQVYLTQHNCSYLRLIILLVVGDISINKMPNLRWFYQFQNILV